MKIEARYDILYSIRSRFMSRIWRRQENIENLNISMPFWVKNGSKTAKSHAGREQTFVYLNAVATMIFFKLRPSSGAG